MPMLRELFDLCTSKVVQVATLLIEQAPSSVSQTLTDICIKPPQSVQQNPTVLGEMLFIHQVWEVNDFSSILTRFWKSIPNTSAYTPGGGLRQQYGEVKILHEVSGVKTLAVYSPFYFSDSHCGKVLFVNQNVSTSKYFESFECCEVLGWISL